MQVREFLTMLARRWKLIVACVLLVTAAAAVATMQQTPSTSRRPAYSSPPTPRATSSRRPTWAPSSNCSAPRDPGSGAGQARTRRRHPLNIAGSVSDNAPILDILVRSANPQVAYAVANEVGPQLESIGGQYAPLLAAAGGSVR